MRYSYTSIKCFLTCPAQFKAKYIEKRLPREDDAPALVRGREIHGKLETAIKTGADPGVWTPDGLVEKLRAAKATAETGLGMNAQGQPVHHFNDASILMGFIDVLVWNDNMALLVDWKTGKFRPDPLQADVYATLLRALAGHSDFPVHFLLVYVDQKMTEMIKPDRYALNRVWELMQMIEREREYPMREGMQCRWCPVLDCPNNRRR